MEQKHHSEDKNEFKEYCLKTSASTPSLDETEDTVFNKPNFFKRYLGIIFAILAALSLCASTLIVKYLQEFTTSEIICYRTLSDIIILLPFLIQKHLKFQLREQAWNLTIRGILITFSYFSSVFAVKRLPVSEANAIIFSYPMLTAIISAITLKNGFSNMKYLSLFVNVLGLALVTHIWSGLDTDRTLGIVSGFVYIMSASSGQVVLKKMSLDVQPQMIVFHMAWMRFAYMIIFTEVSNGFTVPRIPKCDYGISFVSESVLLFAMALFTLGFSLLSGQAIKIENATTVTAVDAAIQLPMFIISQWLVFKNAPSASVVIGVLAVLATSFLLNLDAIAEKSAPESRLKIWVDKINQSFSLGKVIPQMGRGNKFLPTGTAVYHYDYILRQ